MFWSNTRGFQKRLSIKFGQVASALLQGQQVLDKTRDAVYRRMRELFGGHTPDLYLEVPMYGAAQRKILEYLVLNVGLEVSGSRLRVIAEDQIHTERRLRELRDLG